MVQKFTSYPQDGKTANLIHYVIVNQNPCGSIQYARVCRGDVIDAKIKDHNLIVSRANLKLKFREDN